MREKVLVDSQEDLHRSFSSSDSYNLLLRKPKDFVISGMNNKNRINIDGKYSSGASLTIKNCTFDKLEIEKFGDVKLVDCKFSGRYTGGRRPLRASDCDSFTIEKSIVDNMADIEEAEFELHPSGGIVFSDINEVKISDFQVSGFINGLHMSNISSMTVKNTTIGDCECAFHIKSVDIDINEVELDRVEQVLSDESETGSCKINVENSPDMTRILLEEL